MQRSVWGGLSVSAETLQVTQKYGGAILGAFIDRKLAGFLYALLARRNGQIIHWSHLMAILPPFRNQGLGFRLKIAHRNLALRQGIRSVCWTYDPLQSRNAGLNLTKLGGRVEEYIADCYGRFPSLIECGLQSDRFVVNWPIASKKVEQCLTARRPQKKVPDVPGVNLTRSNSHGFLVNRKIELDHNAPRLLVEVPHNTDEMRAQDVALARRWRAQTRQIFMHYLSKDYRVDGFFGGSPGRPATRCFYLLRRANA